MGMSAGSVEMSKELAKRRRAAVVLGHWCLLYHSGLICLPYCRFENVTCAVPGSRFNDSHWGNTAGPNGQRAGHGRPVGAGGLAAKQDMVHIILMRFSFAHQVALV